MKWPAGKMEEDSPGYGCMELFSDECTLKCKLMHGNTKEWKEESYERKKGGKGEIRITGPEL